jgi:hypothetical protein
MSVNAKTKSAIGAVVTRKKIKVDQSHLRSL